MLEDNSITIGKVVWIGRTPGRTVGIPQCEYLYLVNGQEIRKRSERPGSLDMNIGDCYEVRYSNNDLEISELGITKGKINCKD